MSYQLVPLGVRGDLRIYGVRFSGGNFMFWHKVNISVIKKVAVVFEEKYQNIELSDDMILLSLKGINDYQKWNNIINIFIDIMKSDKSKFKFQFVVNNDDQVKVVQTLGNEIGIMFEVNNVNANVSSINESNKVKDDVLVSNDVEPIFYLDNSGNILNNVGNVVGRIGDGVHIVNSEDNSLLKGEQKIGYIGDYKNMDIGGNSLSKGKMLTYKNPNAPSLRLEEDHVAPPLNRAAFVSFPILIFILSALMLIGSMILLFILD